MKPIRVVIATAHTLLREGIRALLARESDIEIVGEAADSVQAQTFAEKLKPDIMLVNGLLLRGPHGLQRARERSPKTKILVFTDGPPGEEALGYIRAGARGAVSKGETAATLAKALRTVAAGEIWATRKIMAQVLQELSALAHRVERPRDTPIARLTPRELKIVELVARGFNNKEVAEGLHLSEKTVKNHLTSVFLKLGLRNRSQLAAWHLRPSSSNV